MKISKLIDSIREWKYVPSFMQSGFTAHVAFGTKAPDQRNVLFGTKYLSGDAVWIEWGPCLAQDHVALKMKLISSGLDYAYSLTSIKMKHPFSVSVKLMEHNRIVCSVDAFEGVESIITTHEKFRKTTLSFDIRPTTGLESLRVKRLR